MQYLLKISINKIIEFDENILDLDSDIEQLKFKIEEYLNHRNWNISELICKKYE